MGHIDSAAVLSYRLHLAFLEINARLGKCINCSSLLPFVEALLSPDPLVLLLFLSLFPLAPARLLRDYSVRSGLQSVANAR